MLIKKNERSDALVAGRAACEQESARFELYAKLDEAEAESNAKREIVSHEEMMRRLMTALRRSAVR